MRESRDQDHQPQVETSAACRAAASEAVVLADTQPRRSVRVGWSKAAREMARCGEDRLLEPYTPTAFDESEWDGSSQPPRGERRFGVTGPAACPRPSAAVAHRTGEACRTRTNCTMRR